MKRFVIALAAIGCLLLNASGAAADEKQEQEPSFWMKQKLIYSQNILHGLVAEDYDEIHQNAMAMKGLNQVEYFVRRKPEGYRTQLRIFQYAVDELAKNASDDDLEGATLAFTQMTISCVNCHKQLR